MVLFCQIGLSNLPVPFNLAGTMNEGNLLHTILYPEYGCYHPYAHSVSLWCENKINFCLLPDNIESKLESVKHKAGPQ